MANKISNPSPDQVRFCGHCGGRLPQSAEFCGYCGQKLPPWEEILALAPATSSKSVAKGTSFAKVGAIACSVGLSIGALSYWLNPGRSSEVPRPSLSVQHPSGITVNAPKGAFLDGSTLRVALSATGPSTGSLDRVAPYLSVDGALVDSGRKPATVVIPLEQDVKAPLVLVDGVGSWIPIPSHLTKTVDGRPAVEISVDGLPLPWRATVVDAPDVKDRGRLIQGDDLGSKLQRLEQLRIVDSDKFCSEVDRLLGSGDADTGTSPSSGHLLWAPAYAQPKSRTQRLPSSPLEVRDALDQARVAFLRIDALLRGLGGSSDRLRLRSSVLLYQDGIAHLYRANSGLKDLSPEERKTPLSDLSYTTDTSLFSGTWPLEDLVEQYCGTFAPWGVDLMHGLLGDESLVERGFDVRVVPYFGHLMHINLSLPGGEQALPLTTRDAQGQHELFEVLESAQDEVARTLELRLGEAFSLQTVQIFSPRLCSWSLDEWILAAKSVRSWYGMVVGIAVLHGSAAGTVGAGTAIAILSPIVELLIVNPVAEQAKQKHGWLGAISVNVLFDGVKLYGQVKLDPKSKLSYTDLLLNFLIDYEALDSLDTLRAQNFGALGYMDRSGWFSQERFPVPPLVLTSNVYGPSQRRGEDPDGPYQLSGWATLRFLFNYHALAPQLLGYKYDLSKAFRLGYKELRFPVDSRLYAQTICGTHWRPLDRKAWNLRLLDDAPDLQVVRWSFPKSQVQQWAGSQGLKMEDFLQKATVEVCLGQQWRDRAYFAVRPALFDKEGQRLSQMLSPESDKKTLHFSLGMAASPGLPTQPQLTPWDMTAEEVGAWAGVPLWTYQQQARKRFVLRIRYDKQVLSEFPVSFGEFAVAGTNLSHAIPTSKRVIEEVRVVPKPLPPEMGRIVWTKPAIPAKELEKLYREHGKFPVALEIEVSYVDDRPPTMHRQEYKVGEGAKLEIKEVDIRNIKRVTETTLNTSTGKKTSDVYLISGNPQWDRLMKGETLKLRWITYRFYEDKPKEWVLSISEEYEAPKEQSPPVEPSGGQPVGGFRGPSL